MGRVMLGAVEAGGTKMVCAVAHEPGELIDEVRFSTSNADETMLRVTEYFDAAQKKFGALAAIGYGTFGPAEVSLDQVNYGKILTTPKLGWEGADVVGYLRQAYPQVPVSFDTDVNAAAVGEGMAGAARGMKHFIYVTVGTGIGGGVVVAGRALKTHPHAEIGHMLIPRVDGDDFGGCCRFHGGCLEGLASGSAMAARWGVPAQELGADHEAWDLEASYLAMMVQNLVACYAPERIILGGGVMEQEFLLEKVRARYEKNAQGYWAKNDSLLVAPALGNRSGITGALVMADELVRGRVSPQPLSS